MQQGFGFSPLIVIFSVGYRLPFLALKKEELSLLRLTSDLYFVDESPLFFLEKQAQSGSAKSDPSQVEGDYAQTYESLIAKGVVDPHGFRVTDNALNRLAPVTECDAKLVFSTNDEADKTIFFLLDEIAVQFSEHDEGFIFGEDLDPKELTSFLGRRLVPSKALFSPIDFTLSKRAFQLLCRILQAPRPDHLSRGALENLNIPQEDTAQFMGTHLHLPQTSVSSGGSPLRELRRKKLLVKKGRHLFTLSAALLHLLEHVRSQGSHRLTRQDFGESIHQRQLILIPLDGGMLGIEPHQNTVRFREFNARSLKKALEAVVGPMQNNLDLAPRRLLPQLLNRDVDDAMDDLVPEPQL